MNSTTRSLDELLQHERFVQRLARSLLGTDDEADDLVQETWLRAVQHPPESSGQAVGWLGTVVRNLAQNMRRGASRREGREVAVARTEATPPLQQVIEREEVRRQIVNALGRIPEAHASAIVLRFFDGLPPREIARRISVPVETVRKRLTRGLAELREELDGTFDGGRAGWTAALPLLVGVPAGGSTTLATATVFGIAGAFLMSTTARVLCVLALVAVGAVFVTRAFFSTNGSPHVVALPVEPAHAVAEAPARVALAAPLAPRPFSEEAPASKPSRTEQPPIAILSAATLRGRCVSAATHEPLSGCRLTLHGWEANSGRMAAFVDHGGTVEWRDPDEQETATDGVFEFRFVPPPPYQFMLTIAAPGRASLDGRWNTLESGAVVDVGDILVPKGTTLRGRIVDENGSPRARTTLSLSRHDDRKEKVSPRRWHHQVTGTDGAFVFEHPLVAGSFAVEVDDCELVDPRVIEIGEAESARSVDIHVRAFSDAKPIAGVVRDDRGDPVAKASIDYSWPRQASARRRELESGQDGAFRIERPEEAPNEPVTIWVRCAGYESSEALTKYEWGRKDVTIVLRRGATVTVVVQDGDLGKPLERFGVRCFGTRGPGARAADKTRLRNSGEHQNGVLELDGVLRGHQFLVVEPEGGDWLPSRGQDFEMTEQGAPPRQEVTVWRSVKKTVVVRSQDGKPVAKTKLELLRPVAGTPVDLKTRALSMSDLAHFWQCAFLLDSGRTDDDGTLEMKGAPGEPLVLRALGPGHAPVVRDVRFDGPETTIEIAVPKGATLVGKILPLEILGQLDPRPLDDPSRKYGLVGVTLRAAAVGSVELPLDQRKAPIGTDGTFRFEGIPAGSWGLRIHYLDLQSGWKPDPSGISSFGSGSMQVGKIDLVDGDERHETFDLTSMLKAEVEGILSIDGKPVDGGAVAFDGLADGSPDEHALAQGIGIGSDGTFKALVWPARYRLVVQTMKDGKRRCVQTSVLLTLAAGQKVRRNFDFPSSTLELRVVASDGVTPVTGALLDIQFPTPSLWPVTAERSDADGRTSAMDLPAGAVTISVWPKSLSTPEALGDFFRSGTNREDVLLRVATVVVTPPDTKATIVLPKSAGY